MTQLTIIGLISFYSAIYGVDPNLATAEAMNESSLNPNAIGKLKEVGLYQIRPEFVKEYTAKQLLQPEINIIVGLQKIKKAQETCVHKNDIEFLVCYNYGNTNAFKGKHPSLFPYVKRVKMIMAQLD